MKTTKGKPYGLGWSFISLLITGLLLTNTVVQAQQSTVVIAEVMYDHPLYDNEKTVTGSEGEFMSLYNYGEEEVDISGWRIMVIPLVSGNGIPSNYIIPANTVISESGLVVIASQWDASFNVGDFYMQEVPDPDSSGIRVLYTNTLAYPDTRTRIRVYDAHNRLQDELVYDGKSAASSGSPLLRAENAVDPDRPITETVSISRKKIVINEGVRRSSKTDYFSDEDDHDESVRLFNYLPEDYSYTAPASILMDGVPDDLTLTGTKTGDKDYRAKTIVSSQVIESGKTQYWAEEGITLGPGFEVKAGSEFYAGVEPDSVHLVKMMTYNLKGKHTEYKKHAQVVKKADPDVVAVQEVRGLRKFNILKEKSGYKGERFCIVADYGIGMLWKQDVVGKPIAIKKQLVSVVQWKDDPDLIRGFLVVEFRDFCFISTHLSLDRATRGKMADKILDNKIVKDCIKNNKPVYIAGDMNEEPDENNSHRKAIPIFIANGFEILNDIKEPTHSTRPSESHIDLILEHNTNQYHKTISRGVPMTADEKKKFFEDEISDHLPYAVRVKLK